jgi:hypothetical protein
MKMTNLKWRLQELPTGGEIADLVERDVITKEEAREILFSPKKDNDEEDVKSLKSEINFLRELVEKMANKGSVYVWPSGGYTHWQHYPWYPVYSQALGTTFTTTGTTSTVSGSRPLNAINAFSATNSNVLQLPKYTIK